MSLLARVRTALFRGVTTKFNLFYHRWAFGMDLGDGVRISLRAHLDRTNPKGVHIGAYTAITAGVSVVTHDFVNREWKEVHIGKNCFVGYNSVILPGVKIGDNCIIAANSVVGRDVPPNSLVMGVPARVVEQNIVTDKWGIRLDRGNSTPVDV